MTLTQILQKISSIFAKKSELSNYLSLSGGNVSSIGSAKIYACQGNV